MRRAILCAAVGLALLLGGCSGNEESSAAREQRPGGVVKRLAEGAAESALPAGRQSSRRRFAVLRTPAEELPADVEGRVERTLGVPAHVLARGPSQRLGSAAGSLWLVEVRGVVCLVHERSGAHSCTPVDEFAARGLSLGLVRAGAPLALRFLTVGIVPGWVDRVVVREGPGSRKSVEVTHGVYEAAAKLPVLVSGYCVEGRGGCRAVPVLHSR